MKTNKSQTNTSKDLDLIIEHLRAVRKSTDNILGTLEYSQTSLNALNDDMRHFDYETIQSYQHTIKMDAITYYVRNNKHNKI